jgi:hypothetical protein
MADGPHREASGGERITARDIERRNRADLGKPLSPVMRTAATARELAARGEDVTKT